MARAWVVMAVSMLVVWGAPPAAAAPTDAFYLNAQLDDYATRKTTKVTLKQLVDFGSGRMSEVKLITGANFVRHEIAVRLAHRLADFQRLPFIVGTSPLLHDIYQLYWASFQKLRQYPEIKSLKARAKHEAGWPVVLGEG